MPEAPYAADLALPYLQRFGAEGVYFQDIQEALGVGAGDLGDALRFLQEERIVEEVEPGRWAADTSEDGVVGAGVIEDDAPAAMDYLVAWETGSAWVSATSAEAAVQGFQASPLSASLDAGDDVAVVAGSHVERFQARVSLVRA